MFREILKGIVEGAGGGIGATLMGYDGIAIEQYLLPQPGVDLNLVAVEYANAIKEIKKAANVLNIGGLEEISVLTERFQVVFRVISDDYFVALILERSGNFGKGRYLLLREASRLRQSLS